MNLILIAAVLGATTSTQSLLLRFEDDAAIVADGMITAQGEAILAQALNAEFWGRSATLTVCAPSRGPANVARLRAVSRGLKEIIRENRPGMLISSVVRRSTREQCPAGIKLRVWDFRPRGTGGEARVVALRGTVSASSKAGQSFPLRKGTVVPEGAEIETGPDSSCALRTSDGGHVRLRERTRMNIDSLAVKGESQSSGSRLKLLVGRLWARVTRRLGGGSPVEVATENAVAGVRGTDFQVASRRVEGSQVTDVAVYEGKVALGVGEEELDVPAGFSLSATKTLGKLRPLPEAPSNLMPREGSFEGEAFFKWDTVADAERYRVEFSRRPDFESIVFSREFVRSPARIWAGRGDYYWRVVAINADDIESAPSRLYRFQMAP